MHFYFTRLLFALVLLVPVSASAFNPVVQTPEQPYQAIEIDELEASQWWLGTLEGFPDLYEFTISEPTTLHLQLTQDTLSEPSALQLLVVRQNDDSRGVSEVFRQAIAVEEWEPRTSLTLGLPRISMPESSEELAPGTYRVEVSSPNNDGNYLLYAGRESESTSFYVGISDLLLIQSHFEASPFRVFLSIYFLIPLLLILSIGAWFKYRRQ